MCAQRQAKVYRRKGSRRRKKTLDWITDGFIDENKDYVRTGKGLDGTLYGFILCEHNPPHSVESRWVTGKNESPEGNSTVIVEF